MQQFLELEQPGVALPNHDARPQPVPGAPSVAYHPPGGHKPAGAPSDKAGKADKPGKAARPRPPMAELQAGASAPSPISLRRR
jgi:hypothetical protein